VFGFALQPAHASGGARLIIQRSANFGNALGVHLMIDGHAVANIDVAHRYDGYVSPGRHTVTVEARPNTLRRPPTSMRVNFRAGRTYLYTIGWGSKQLVLRPASINVPAVPAPPAIR
jgi:hypothetical protein